MAESTRYIWCQHCYTGWIAKEDKPYYPKCWSCGMGWRKRTRRPRWWSAEDAAQWPHTYPAQEVGYDPPPGLGRPARTQMTTAEYRTAVAQLWGSADPGTQRLSRAAGVPPPDPEEHDLDPTALSRVTSAYKLATAELRTLVEKKGRLQAKADRAKAEFEKAVQDLASVSQAIEKQTESVARAQEEVRRKVADQEQPRIQDLTGILRTVGRADRGTAECCPCQNGSHACSPQQRRFQRSLHLMYG